MTARIATLAVVLLSGIVQAQERLVPTTRPTTLPSTTQASTQPVFEITIDCQVEDLKEWSESLRPIVEKWYPIIVQTLPSEGYTAPRKFKITIRESNQIAFARGTEIVCGAKWFRERPNDRGAVVHELVHVVQQYRSRRNPSWLVEGIADYIRWFKYEPKNKRPRPNPNRAKYTDSYQTTGAFIEWLCANKDHELAVKFNAAMRQGRYSPDLWQEYTGQTVDELWAEYIETLRTK